MVLSHETKLQSLYDILHDGFLRKRSETNNSTGYSPLLGEKIGDPNYVYIGTIESVPLTGSVRLYFSDRLLTDLNYFLNIGWKYGRTSDSFEKSEANLKFWLENVGKDGEILFTENISLVDYLEKIVVPQYSNKISEFLKSKEYDIDDRVLDMSKIDEKYHKYIVITENY